MSKFAVFVALLFCSIISSSASNKIPGVFTFGDSTMDPGNNNNLKTEMKANHLPYGEDLPNAPIGRFCNGKLTPDYVVASLNLSDVLPAYAGHVITEKDFGVSFASSGSGMDDWTANSMNVTTLSGQIDQFTEYIEKLKIIKGNAKTMEFIKKSVHLISVGSNDMMISYYAIPLRRAMFTVPQYHDFLLGRLKTFLQHLHTLGVRNFAMAGLPPLGCVPIQMTQDAIGLNPFGMVYKLLKPKCVAEKNDDATKYNIKLQAMLADLELQFNAIEKSKVVYVDIYTPLFDMATNPAKYGFKETTRGCCGTGKAEFGPFCRSYMPTCSNHSEHMWWDAVHPSQAAYKNLANVLIEKNLPLLI